MKNILYIAKSSNEVLASKLEPLALSPLIEKIFLLRDEPYSAISSKIIQINFNSNFVILRIIAKIFQGIKCIFTNNVDYIFTVHLTPHGYLGYFLSFITLKPHFHIINAGSREIELGNWFYRCLNKIVVKHASRVIVQGNNTRKFLLGLGLNESKIAIVPNAILINESIVKTTNAFITRDIDFLTVSRLVPNKRTLIILENLDNLSRALEKILKLYIIGNGPEYQKIEDWVNKKANEYLNVTLTGWLHHDEIASYYIRSRYFILVSDGEGVPRSMLEAISFGCVPIVSDVGDISDYVSNGYNGFLIRDINKFDRFLKDIYLQPNDIYEDLHYNIQKKKVDMKSLKVDQIYHNLIKEYNK